MSTPAATSPESSQIGLRSITLEGFVLFSLIMQFMLVIVAPWRKNHKLNIMLLVVRVGYLLNSWSANFAMGLIPGSTGRVHSGRTEELGIFWASFLIFNLGGPSSIIGLSMSDNDLWLRYAVRLFPLSYTFGRVFLRFFLKKDVWVPTAIMFFAGAIRYIEKVICRFLARQTKFRDSTLPKPDPGVNYARLAHLEMSARSPDRTTDEHIPRSGPVQPDSKIKLSQVQIVKEGYRFFDTFRGLFVNSVYTYDQRDESRRYFLSRDAEDAFAICEVELSFAYDVFYTKSILNDKPLVLRYLNFVSFLLQLVSAILWIRIDKTSFHRSSVLVTDALVYGSILLDLISLFIFATSDWVIASVNHNTQWIESFYEKLLKFKKRVREKQRRAKFWRVFYRWSELISQVNLLRTCLWKSSKPEYERKWTKKYIIPVVPFLNLLRFTSGVRRRTRTLTIPLRNFIFSELLTRAAHCKHPIDVEELCSSRGLWALNLLSQTHPGLKVDTLRQWITDVDYEESVILWHIATTLCYYTQEDEENQEDQDDADTENRKCSKILGDYMLDLLTRVRGEMMPKSVVILGRNIFINTWADGKRFLDKKLAPRSKKDVERELLVQACKKILQVNTDVIPPRRIRGDKSKSVLFDGCLLAKELQRLNQETEINIWEIISKVWAEMLFYTAAQTNATMHLHRLNFGGELLTLVWLLMAHLGLGKNHFRNS